MHSSSLDLLNVSTTSHAVTKHYKSTHSFRNYQIYLLQLLQKKDLDISFLFTMFAMSSSIPGMTRPTRYSGYGICPSWTASWTAYPWDHTKHSPYTDVYMGTLVLHTGYIYLPEGSGIFNTLTTWIFDSDIRMAHIVVYMLIFLTENRGGWIPHQDFYKFRV